MLKLADRFHAVRLASNDYQLLSLTESVRIKGSNGADGVLDLIFPLLRSGKSLKGILKRVGGGHRQATLDLVHDLEARGLIERSRGRRDLFSAAEKDAYGEQVMFLSHFSPMGAAVPSTPQTRSATAFALQRRLRDATVLLVGLGRLGSRLAEALAAIGVGHIVGSDNGRVTARDLVGTPYTAAHLGAVRALALQSQLAERNRLVQFAVADADATNDVPALPANVDLVVLCEDVFDPIRYRDFNRLCIQQNVRWTSCRTLGFRIELGPTVLPHETACFRCYELRKMGNTLIDTDQWPMTDRYDVDQRLGPISLNATLGDQLMAVEVLKLLTGFSRPLTHGAVLTFELLSYEMRQHPVLRVPRCSDCGRAQQGRPSINTWLLDETPD
jgi:sulfur carrier protein ThiS adenylyltransferase